MEILLAKNVIKPYKEGPVPALEAASVVVPESPINLSYESVNALHQAVSHVPLEDDGIVYYMETVATLNKMLEYKCP